jgi:conjugative relaxase-like TrwC/TraI family protein
VVTGFALSFSPPKSVSLVGAFGGPAVAGEVRAAHEAAVRAALAFLEDHAAFSRTGKGGMFQVDTEGFVAAAFTHRTSRAGDPQLHSHVLVAKWTQTVLA